MSSLASSSMDVGIVMSAILGTMIAALAGLVTIQTPINSSSNNNKNEVTTPSSFFPSMVHEPSKRAYEMFVASYTPIWILVFAIVVVGQLYENFTAWNYLQLCGGLALPLLLQPILVPSAGMASPDMHRPLVQRYAFKANVWIAIYSFIGNYWYTHYFYSVLQAEYTMPSHRLNHVPIAMYFATHFYFSTYHFFSNALLRKVITTYQPGPTRTLLFIGVVLVFSYFTAFSETLSISAYPYWSFQDRYMVYTIGSAFYGIYFLVSFPGFFYFDQDIDKPNSKPFTLWDTVVSSCGHGMLILTLLDLVRLYLNIPLTIGAPAK